jgi:hypothetical protein
VTLTAQPWADPDCSCEFEADLENGKGTVLVFREPTADGDYYYLPSSLALHKPYVKKLNKKVPALSLVRKLADGSEESNGKLSCTFELALAAPLLDKLKKDIKNHFKGGNDKAKLLPILPSLDPFPCYAYLASGKRLPKPGQAFLTKDAAGNPLLNVTQLVPESLIPEVEKSPLTIAFSMPFSLQIGDLTASLVIKGQDATNELMRNNELQAGFWKFVINGDEEAAKKVGEQLLQKQWLAFGEGADSLTPEGKEKHVQAGLLSLHHGLLLGMSVPPYELPDQLSAALMKQFQTEPGKALATALSLKNAQCALPETPQELSRSTATGLGAAISNVDISKLPKDLYDQLVTEKGPPISNVWLPCVLQGFSMKEGALTVSVTDAKKNRIAGPFMVKLVPSGEEYVWKSAKGEEISSVELNLTSVYAKIKDQLSDCKIRCRLELNQTIDGKPFRTLTEAEDTLQFGDVPTPDLWTPFHVVCIAGDWLTFGELTKVAVTFKSLSVKKTVVLEIKANSPKKDFVFLMPSGPDPKKDQIEATFQFHTKKGVKTKVIKDVLAENPGCEFILFDEDWKEQAKE